MSNFIGMLNERSQIEFFSFKFETVEKHGPDHNPTFKVALYTNNERVTDGVAPTVKAARQVAAEAYFAL